MRASAPNLPQVLDMGTKFAMLRIATVMKFALPSWQSMELLTAGMRLKDAVKIGIILFGNRVIMPDGQIVSPATGAQPLTHDMDAVVAAGVVLPLLW